MSTVEKSLAPGEVRFVPKPRTYGRNTTWSVYDRARGSYPAIVAGYGHVPQSLSTEAEAQVVAERLEEFYAGG